MPRMRSSSAPWYFRMKSTAVFEATEAAFRIMNALEPPVLVSDPAPAIIARPEIAARPKPLDLLHQRQLHAFLAAELHERGHAVAQQLDHGEHRVELERRR